MVFQKIFNQVADYDKWVVGYKKHTDFRKQMTSVGTKAYTVKGNKNHIQVILEWQDQAKMKEFGESPGLKEAMKNAGLIAPPEFAFSPSNNFDVSNFDFQFETDG